MEIIKGHLVAGDGNCLYIQRKNIMYKREEERENPIFDIKIPFWKRVLINLRLCQRLFRTDIRAAGFYKNKLFYALLGNLYSYHLVSGEHKKELEFRAGMKAPLGMTYISGIKGFEEQICFGDYFTNRDREDVSIWSCRGEKWEIVYTFPPNSIRHIHGIVADTYRDCVYIMTGDNDDESAVWKAENDFKDVRKLFGGDQQARCCILHPQKDGIVYATDSEYEQNRIYKVHIRSGNLIERTVIRNLDGSVIHGCNNGEKLYFSTTVEPDKGGIFSDRVVVYKMDQGGLHEIISDKKDGFSLVYFMYGFADIIESNGLLYVGFTATKKYDGKILRMDEKHEG